MPRSTLSIFSVEFNSSPLSSFQRENPREDYNRKMCGCTLNSTLVAILFDFKIYCFLLLSLSNSLLLNLKLGIFFIKTHHHHRPLLFCLFHGLIGDENTAIKWKINDSLYETYETILSSTSLQWKGWTRNFPYSFLN